MKYKKADERKDIGEYKYKPQESTKGIATWTNDSGKHIVAMKGSNDIDDIIPDLNIAAGTYNKTKHFK